MPWTTKKNSKGQTCVYKKDADGNPTGKTLGCHDSDEEANKQIQALHANVKEYDNSLSDFVERVRTAFDKAMQPFNQSEDLAVWATDVFEDHVVVRRGETYFRVSFTVDGEIITFAPQNEWEKVRLSYVAEQASVTNTESEAFGYEMVTEFGGREVPSVPFAPGVNMQELLAGDDDPMFLTMEISRIGEVSTNGLIHDEDLARSIERQIMENRPGGIMGHIPKGQEDSAFPVSQIHWVGATFDGQSTWGKGYIPRRAEAVRDEYRILKAKRGKAANSIWGGAIREFDKKNPRLWRARNLKLERVDLAPYQRAARKGDGTFMITSEMADGESPAAESEEQEMDKTQVLAELSAKDIMDLPQFADVREALFAEFSAEHQTTDRIAELEQQATAKDERIAELETKNEALTLTVAEFEGIKFGQDLDAQIAEMTDWTVNTDEGKAKLASLRGVMRKMALLELGDVREMEQAKTTLEGLMTGELKALFEMTRDALAGPAVIVPGKDRGNGAGLEYSFTPEEERQAAAEVGLSV
jgi:hypothetical protein